MLKILKAESGRGLLRVNASPGQRNRKHRAALDWSHRPLTTEQQTVFRRLGVMSGSFDIDAAQQICAELDADQWEVLDRLAALVDKSLEGADSRPGADRAVICWRRCGTSHWIASTLRQKKRRCVNAILRIF